MPTPVGHALGGLAAALAASSTTRGTPMSWRLLWISAAAAVAPDLDILAGTHRSYTHSVGAVALVAALGWLIFRRLASPARSAVKDAGSAAAATAIVTSAFASHLLLDWLGKDTSSPPGLMLWWPFSAAYHMSGLDLFGEVSRRYWLPREFILGNFEAVAWELLIVGPAMFLAWVVWSKRTLKAG
jgi:hypothetical protein